MDDEHDPELSSSKQHAFFQAEQSRFLQGLANGKRAALQKEIQLLRSFLWWREELRDLSTQYYYYIRKFTLALADKWVARGILQHAGDLFFLPFKAIQSFIHHEISATDMQTLIQKNQTYYQSFRNFANPNEIGDRHQSQLTKMPAKGALRITGVPCSPGSVTAKVKVIKNIHDADRLRKGDILITRFTDPAWTPKFHLIAGVATETGGILSHAAVIAREYGIPAVLAIKDLTKRVENDRLITLNGHTGEILLHT